HGQGPVGRDEGGGHGGRGAGGVPAPSRPALRLPPPARRGAAGELRLRRQRAGVPAETARLRAHVRTTSDLGLTSAAIDDRALSRLSQGLIGSEVLRIAAEVRAAVAAGREVCNLTVGDFDPREFPLPRKLADGIRAALEAGHSNYPPSNGVLELRKAIVEFYRREMSLDYPLESVLVAGGARPLIYATYRALVDPGDAVALPVPSWNNNHYAYLTGAPAT